MFENAALLYLFVVLLTGRHRLEMVVLALCIRLLRRITSDVLFLKDDSDTNIFIGYNELPVFVILWVFYLK
jgi:hypothetical protein